MFKSAIALTIGIMLSLIGSVANADPIKLKLAFFLSDRVFLYTDLIKPFVDAVNAESRGEVEVEIYSSGVLGKDPVQQAQMVLDGTADIAYVVPGTSARFTDNAVVELPGLYSGFPEATTVYTRLVAAGALRGYQDFFPVATFATELETIHSRRSIASLDDLKGQKIRSSGPLQAAAFGKLGAEPIIMPASAVPEAMSSGAIDGAAFSLSPLREFGIARIAPYHYLLGVSAGPLALLMNRKKFDSLPANAQAVIRRYSGEWAAQRISKCCQRAIQGIIEQLKADPRRKVVEPSPSDLSRAQVAFASVVDDWAARDPRNQELLRLVRAEVAKLRTTR